MTDKTIPADIIEKATDAFLLAILWDTLEEQVGEIARAIVAERQRCACKAEELAEDRQRIRLALGEMTAQEMRSVRAALKWAAGIMRGEA